MPSSSDSVPRVDLQIATKGDIPSLAQFETWVASSLPPDKSDAELTIRVVEPSESQTLNRTYRHRDKPTNVLSFPADLPAEVDIPLLGDLVICAEIVSAEATDQQKLEEAHWAHMTIHGTLHLLGYDHTEDRDAEVMEQLETEILNKLGFPCPYNDLTTPASPTTGEGE